MGQLAQWLREEWVDISRKKKGKHPKCGRKTAGKGKYPKCVPKAKASKMTASQKKSAVSRKRSAGNAGPKPTNVKTFKNGGEVRKIARGCGKVMNNRRKKTKYS
jgi:hypothetical protein